MALRVMSMAEIRLEVLLEAARSGETVAEVCRRHGICRQTYYRYLVRYQAQGIEGLEPRSRQPVSQPARMAAEVELELCRLRKDHPRWGARRIRAELLRAGKFAPAVSSIHQALVRNNLVALRPPRPKPADIRFERASPNDLWQIDATRVVLATGTPAWVMDILDDHARFCLAARVASGPTGEAAWEAMESALRHYGLPRQVLSDNGTCFSGKLIHGEVDFERRLAALGVQLITSRPYHPQTLGKLERFHRTMKEWLTDHAVPGSIEGLQVALDRFREHYNQERPHQGLEDLTPAERYQPKPGRRPATPPEPAQPLYPPGSVVRTVDRAGVIGYRRASIGLGKRWRHLLVRIVELGGVTHIYFGEELIRSLVLDPESGYQRSTSDPRLARPGRTGRSRQRQQPRQV
jgi:transposase InsO family protein